MHRVLAASALFVVLAAASHAGLIGWMTSRPQNWKSVQEAGGIRIGAPTEKDGRKVLPVEYDISGLTAVTRKPTVINSGLVVRKIELKRQGAQIILRVVSQLVEEHPKTAKVHYADLSEIPAGTYEVYYEDARDPAKQLGRIEVK
jgi:hypothetical protein